MNSYIFGKPKGRIMDIYLDIKNPLIWSKDKDIIDEIPGAYKNIKEVMNNQKDLVEIAYTLKQVICVKG